MARTARLFVARAAIILSVLVSAVVVSTSAAQATPHIGCGPRLQGYQVTATYIYVYDYIACQDGDITGPVSVSRLAPVSPPIYWTVVASGQGEVFYICNGSANRTYKVHFGTSNPQFTANCG
jgi:hypothetical protein